MADYSNQYKPHKVVYGIEKVIIMRIKETFLKDQVLKEINVAYGDFYFFKETVVSEIFEGVLFDYEKAKPIINAVYQFYGDNPQVFYISNRCFAYSMKVQDWLKFYKERHAIRGMAVVNYSKIGLTNFLIEKLFIKSSLRHFTSLDLAVNWIQNVILHELESQKYPAQNNRLKALSLCMSRFIPFIALLLCCSFASAQDHLTKLDSLSPHFVYDIRYATDNNFVGEAVYDCGICLLRPEAAIALNKANEYFMSKGYCIKIYDCYRPYEVQKKLWEKVPNPAYVADPYNGGSIHNRGAAIDLALVTLDGEEVDFGTDYDFFGIEAHMDNYNHSEEVLANRKLLQEGMKMAGFKGIRTEWWHFSYTKSSGSSIIDKSLPCNDK